MPRLGFFGAMNRDVVYATNDTEGLLAELGIAAPVLLETEIDDATIARGAAALTKMGASSFLGGSAYNAARVAGLLNAAEPMAALEFFGLAGSIDAAAAHVSELTDLGFSTKNVTISDRLPATCLALVDPRGRTLLTATGANAGIGALMRRERQGLIDGFARCEVIHLTSFLDPDVPALLAEILAGARRTNPDLMVSIDPGVLWARPELPAIRALLAQSQLLHVNTEELAILTANDGISALGEMLRQPDWTVVARTHDGVQLHHGGPDGITSETVDLPSTDQVDVVDAVGAGDTFTGAFLWSAFARRDPMSEAARLGFAAARAKIAQLGPITAQKLAAIR